MSGIKINVQKSILVIAFLLYFIILIKALVFKYPPGVINDLFISRNQTWDFRLSNSNIIPLKTISYYLTQDVNISILIKNLLGNIFLFTPLGFFTFKLFKKKTSILLILSFCVSATFEVFQLLMGVGCFDIDDIILNVLGAFIGYLIVKLIYKKRNYPINI